MKTHIEGASQKSTEPTKREILEAMLFLLKAQVVMIEMRLAGKK